MKYIIKGFESIVDAFSLIIHYTGKSLFGSPHSKIHQNKMKEVKERIAKYKKDPNHGYKIDLEKLKNDNLKLREDAKKYWR